MPAPRELDAVMGFLAGALRRQGPVGHDPHLAELSRRFVTGNERLSPDQQVDVYRRQYWLRHVDSLVEDYPGLVHLMDEEGFETFARQYLEKHPPAHPSLRDLGHAIVPFGERWQGFPAGLRGACVDMLRYEHAFIDLFDGAEPPPLAAAALASLDGAALETARVVLHPLLARLKLGHAVHDTRRAVKNGDPAPPPVARTSRLVLSRQEGIVHCDELEALPFDLLGRLARGEALVAACAALAAALDDAAQERLRADVGAWFQTWTASKWIVGVETEGRA